ncbi:hypothetical protein NDU88_003277 [Pleurodeles waltl]|uniref:DDE Tnp4 domain-containing protein n=1 Tax=Pleurodeles waltl TaxID=8319 RepID=A0AAV7TQL5_PLEWA|nr:hypothetical protein NDU88_003277 [Pleurodeles waltl]
MNRRWRHTPMYRPLVDLAKLEDMQIILAYILDRATITELCAQLEPDLISAIRHPTGISPCCASSISAPFPGNWFFPSDSELGSRNVTANALNSAGKSLLRHAETHVQLHCFPPGDSGYPNLSWLLIPVRKARTRAEERYNEAHGRTRRIIERTIGLLKARFRCLHLTGGSLSYSPKKVSQIVVAFCMLHNLALRRKVPFLQEEETGDAPVAAMDPEDSEDLEAVDEDVDNRALVILQYFQ